MELNEQQLSRFNKKDIIQLLLQSMESEKKIREEMEILTKELKQTNHQMQILLEKWNLAQAKRFGRSSEKKLVSDDAYDQLELAAMFAECFNEAEATVGGQPPEEPDINTVTVSEHKRKKSKGKRDEDLNNLPHDIVECDLTEEELIEKLGPGYRRLNDEIYKRLEMHPATFEVKEYHVAVYVSRDGKTFAKGIRKQKDLFRNSIATPSILAAIYNYKFVNAMPIYRLSQDFKRSDLNLSPQVMSNWVIKGSEVYLSLIYEELKKQLLKHHVLQADETTLKVTDDGRAAGTPSYMWVYLTGEHDETGEKIVLFDYQKTRATENPRKFLEGFGGVVVSDGYVSYQQLSKEMDLTASGCWAHCRRRYSNAIKAVQKTMTQEQIDKSIAGQALRQIGAIYKLDESWKNESKEYRLDHRKRILTPLVDEYFRWVKEKVQSGAVPPESETGEGLTYSINQEKYLRAFLEDGEIPIDNSAAERAVRPFCVGRKNWNIVDTIHGAQASAIAYSIAETAKANGLKPYQYFKHLLTELPKRIDEKMNGDFTVKDLLPWSPSLPEECKKRI